MMSVSGERCVHIFISLQVDLNCEYRHQTLFYAALSLELALNSRATAKRRPYPVDEQEFMTIQLVAHGVVARTGLAKSLKERSPV